MDELHPRDESRYVSRGEGPQKNRTAANRCDEAHFTRESAPRRKYRRDFLLTMTIVEEVESLQVYVSVRSALAAGDDVGGRHETGARAKRDSGSALRKTFGMASHGIKDG